MKQMGFASAEYAGKKRVTRPEKFLGEMAQGVPWAALEAVIEPYCPKSGRVGRPPIGVPLMLRMSFLQQWFGLSDDGLEDAVYDSCAMREFLAIDLSVQDVPDATTVLKFRRLLETHGLTAQIFEAINAHLSERGLRPTEIDEQALGELDAEKLRQVRQHLLRALRHQRALNEKLENQIRPIAIAETTGCSPAACTRAAVVMSLLQSARMNGHDPYACLKDVLTRLPMHRVSRIEELLPQRWKPVDV